CPIKHLDSSVRCHSYCGWSVQLDLRPGSLQEFWDLRINISQRLEELLTRVSRCREPGDDHFIFEKFARIFVDLARRDQEIGGGDTRDTSTCVRGKCELIDIRGYRDPGEVSA